MSRDAAPHGALFVHSRHETTTIPLTGDPRHDALLARLAAFGGTVTRTEATDPDTLAREVMRDG
jgi:hypothetical protein